MSKGTPSKFKRPRRKSSLSAWRFRTVPSLDGRLESVPEDVLKERIDSVRDKLIGIEAAHYMGLEGIDPDEQTLGGLYSDGDVVLWRLDDEYPSADDIVDAMKWGYRGDVIDLNTSRGLNAELVMIALRLSSGEEVTKTIYLKALSEQSRSDLSLEAKVPLLYSTS